MFEQSWAPTCLSNFFAAELFVGTESPVNKCTTSARPDLARLAGCGFSAPDSQTVVIEILSSGSYSILANICGI